MSKASSSWTLALALGLTSLLSFAASGARAESDEDDDQVEYGLQGQLEFGGSLNIAWTPDLFTVGATPQIGWFVIDRLELSARFMIGFQNAKDDDGRTKTTAGSVLFEPSYHLPIADALFLLGGVGVGVGYADDKPQFEVAPRVGLNIQVGRSGVLTPAVLVPILIGKNHGADNDETGVLAGVTFEIGFSTVF
jgi:hypothetical protein